MSSLSADIVQPDELLDRPDENRLFIDVRLGEPADELRSYCRAKLAHFKVPHGFTFVPELPRTATGKIQKFVLRNNRPNLSAQ